jgi:long-chain acyl-CoA synthetase
MASFLQQDGGEPDRPAVVMAETGESLSHRELEENSARLANLWYAAGLRPGDHVALMMGNHLRFMEVYWAAMRSGLYFTTINSFLTAGEVEHIVRDSGAAALVVDAAVGEQAAAVARLDGAPAVRHAVGGEVAGFASYEEALAGQPTTPLDEQPMGARLLYSSGSTGLPKAIERSLPDTDVVVGAQYHADWLSQNYGMTWRSVAVSPAPLSHAAPLSFSAGALALGSTLVLMRKFDPELLLTTIERYAATHALMVPTMFVRLLRLPADVREAADVSSLRYVVHGAAPCPVPVKRQMIEWWGPVIWEYYAGTEDNGSTYISSEEWLTHEGSVGRAAPGSVIHICGPEGDELPAGTDGVVYFEQVGSGVLEPFTYHGAPDKTDRSRHPHHPRWTTLGDVGHLDDEGYLYLTDRVDYMVISGGVNISPQEVEDTLMTHPAVLDVAVFGIPHPDLGQAVQAVVQLADGTEPTDAVRDELLAFCRQRLARHKVPRALDFLPELPRSSAGKLYKRRLQAAYADQG